MRARPVSRVPFIPMPPRQRPRRAYSLLEVLITVLIIQIISSMVLVNVSNVTRSEKLSRAADKFIVAARYARMVAMSTGTNTGIEIDTTNNTFRVFQGPTFATVPNSMIPGGSYVVDLDTDHELSGVTLTSPNLAGTSGNPYRVTYGVLGGTVNNGRIFFSYGGVPKPVDVPLVGDPVAP